MTHPEGDSGTSPEGDSGTGPGRDFVASADTYTSRCDRAIAEYLRLGVRPESLDRNGQLI